MKIVQPIIINDAALLSTNVSETLYPPYDAGYSFALGARAQVVGPDLHQVYESLVDGNLGNTPATSPAKWAYVSVTNPWLMFDRSVTSQTVQQDSISVSIRAAGRCSALALLNVSATSARVVMTDAIEGEVYDRTFSLVSDSGIDNLYSYFFEPIVRLQDLMVLDLPLYASSTITVTLSAPGEEVKCGALLIGPSTNVGGTEYGATVGIQDFSVKQQDEWGNYSIVERAFRKRASFPVIVDAGRVDTLQSLLAALRATPTLYIGTDEYKSTAVYGFYKDFTVQIAYPTESVLEVEIEGLT
ncbi:hypothetical protein SAMN05216428_10173 [Nitrosospira sp. Nsp11]|uniref:hypothetical protein n=1 Tax=Nitrosospira sp. Nsp11 TaxID=1855338 RepID=UPI000912A3EF|nr:hypothetical protein [Nitrosospira sp. Nsp11]SHL10056.1 hypothetical protein SAMN05216428_10173 [Nitrosospira sp. Nsp11]